MIHLVSLLARAGHGKTTIARHLEETYGTQTVSLAGALKRCAQAVMKFDDAQLFGTQEQKEAIDPFGAHDAKGEALSARIFLQRLGTEGLRGCFGENIHLEGMKQEILRRAVGTGRPRSPVFICDDTRFKNEVRYIRALLTTTGDHRPSDGTGGPAISGTVFKIICEDAPPSGNDNHPSEREVDEIVGGHIDAEIISSRARGVAHLIGEFEATLSLPKFRSLALALEASQRHRDSLRSFGV